MNRVIKKIYIRGLKQKKRLTVAPNPPNVPNNFVRVFAEAEPNDNGDIMFYSVGLLMPD